MLSWGGGWGKGVDSFTRINTMAYVYLLLLASAFSCVFSLIGPLRWKIRAQTAKGRSLGMSGTPVLIHVLPGKWRPGSPYYQENRNLGSWEIEFPF